MRKRLFPLVLALFPIFSSCSTYKPITIKENIIYDYFKQFKSVDQKNYKEYKIKLENYEIRNYYGSYNGAYVVNVKLNPNPYNYASVIVEWEFKNNKKLIFPDPSYIPLVWKDHVFYSFTNKYLNEVKEDCAYELGIISDDDLDEIQKHIDYYQTNHSHLDIEELDKEYK